MDLQFKKYKKNEIIYHMEDIPQAIGIVKEGSVVIEKTSLKICLFLMRFNGKTC